MFASVWSLEGPDPGSNLRGPRVRGMNPLAFHSQRTDRLLAKVGRALRVWGKLNLYCTFGGRGKCVSSGPEPAINMRLKSMDDLNVDLLT